jgi:hypothetical protein
MKDFLRNFLRFVLDILGLDLVRSSSRREFHKFFTRLQPYKTNIPLIRAGGNHDGGYLLPDDLSDLDAVYSPGVAESSDFEAFFLAQGLRCYLADNSVVAPPIQDKNISFERKHLGLWESEREMSLEYWVRTNTPNASELLLQMDIEGSEWAVLTHAPDNILKQFRIIIVEFHDIQKVFNNEGLSLATQVLEKMLRFFEVVHVHPNNGGGYIKFRGKQIPRVIEVTFIRKDRVISRELITEFPHNLDSPNLPMLPDEPLSSTLFVGPQ